MLLSNRKLRLQIYELSTIAEFKFMNSKIIKSMKTSSEFINHQSTTEMCRWIILQIQTLHTN